MTMPLSPRGQVRADPLEPWCGFFTRLVRQNGPEPDQYAAFHGWLEGLADAARTGVVAPDEVQRLLAMGGDATGSLRTLQGFARLRPHGYPGDFEIIDRIHQHWLSPDPAFVKWDRFFQAQAASRAVRNRTAYFYSWLRQAESRLRGIVPCLYLLQVGGGPGRELHSYYQATPESRVVSQVVDSNRRAIAHAARVCAPEGSKVVFHQSNPLLFRPAIAPHLIWSAGLLDYLTDLNAVALLQRLWRLLVPGGEMAMGNFGPENPSRAYMELGGWMLHHRDASHLTDIALRAGAPEKAIRVGCEAEGVNLFLHLHKGVGD